MALTRRSGQRFTANAWPGFVDAMTALLLVLMFVLSIFMIVQFVLSETIDTQGRELNDLSLQVGRLVDALGVEEARAAALTEQVEDLTDQRDGQLALLARLRADARSLETRIAEGDAEVAGLVERTADLEAILTETREENDAQAEAARLAAARREALEAVVADLRGEAEDRETSLAAALSALDGSRGEAEALSGDLAREADARLAAEADADALRDRLSAEEEARLAEAAAAQALRDRLAGTEAALSDEEAARLAEAAAAETLRARLDGAEAELTTTALALEEARAEAEETLTLLAAADAARDDLDARLALALAERDAAARDGAETVERLARAVASLEVRDAAVSDRDAELAALRARLDTAGVAAEDAAETRAALERRLAALTRDRDVALGAADDASARIAALEAELATLRDDAGDLDARLALALAEIDAAAAREAEAADDLAATLARLDTSTDRADAMAAELERLSASLGASETRVADAGAVRAELERRLAATLAERDELGARAETEAGALRDALSRATAERDAARDEAASLRASGQEARDDLTARLEASLAQADAARAEAEAARDRAAALVADLEDADARADRLAARSEEADARIAALEGGVADRESEVADIQDRLTAAIAQRLAEREESEAELNAVRDELTRALSESLAASVTAQDALDRADRTGILLDTARTELSEADALKVEAQVEAARLTREVADLNGRLRELNDLLGSASLDVETGQDRIAELDGRLGAALERIARDEQRRREAAEAEQARLAAEAERLQTEAERLAAFQSQFFGQLRRVLEGRDGVEVVGDRFVFSSEVLFDTGQARLRPEGEGQIAEVADVILDVADEIPDDIDWILRVDGHTDDQALSGAGRYRDNWELSQARALSVVNFLIDEAGVPPGRLAATGFGEHQPVDPPRHGRRAPAQPADRVEADRTLTRAGRGPRRDVGRVAVAPAGP